MPRVLSGHQPFIANLHGVAEDGETWVFTQSELKALARSNAYTTVVTTCLSAYTVLFLGITADDMAVGGHLERLTNAGLEMAPHFWLTDRLDYATDQWAEEAGVEVIRYDSSEDHAAVGEFFADLRSFVASEPDEDTPSVPSSSLAPAPAETLPPPEVLVKENAEAIRVALNAHARGILSGDGRSEAQALRDYAEFYAEYDEPIYHAWYTSTIEGKNHMLGYTLEEEIARGTFGRVFKAQAPDGTRVAVKVLLEEIRKDESLRHSFRRGVKSMQILHSHGVSGMVSYQEASEIPAFVVMNWIDGPNLERAKVSGYIEDWPILLRIAHDLTRIVRTGHFLPERVLHRDIRPSNVMLKDYFTKQDGGWEVVVLDFDLSWHRGAYEQTAMLQTAVGYLAPEQTRRIAGVSTRNAAVDSFGLGMTLFYLCGGDEPAPNQHLNADWPQRVRKACRKIAATQWESLPERFARMILASTRDRQAERWDISEILGELAQLEGVVSRSDSTLTPELLAEEIAARSSFMSGYEWDSDRLRAIYASPTGLSIALTADTQRQRVLLQAEYSSTGVESRRGFGKFIEKGASVVVEKLRASGWAGVERKGGSRDVEIRAHIALNGGRGQAADTARSVDDALEHLRFSDSR